jgi:hypothetical protein
MFGNRLASEIRRAYVWIVPMVGPELDSGPREE